MTIRRPRPPCRYCQGDHVYHVCPSRRPKFRRFTYEARSNGPGTANSFVVYGWGVYPRHSVLAYQDMKVWLGEYDTPDQAIADYPKAKPSSRWIEQPNTFNHLPSGPDLR